MTNEEREELRSLYIRVCKDSNFKMDYIKAAHFAAEVLSTQYLTSALDFWIAFGSLELMEQIALGNHPAVKGN